MEIKGFYFDGKTSRPYPIFIDVDNQDISVLIADESSDIPLTVWPLADCKIESLNASEHVLVKHPEYEGQLLEFKGRDAKQVITLVTHDDGVIQRSYQTMMTENPVRVIVGAMVVLFVTGYFYLAHFSPFLANRIVDITPRSAEIKLGESTFNQITSFMDIDSVKSAEIQAFYKACGFRSEYPVEVYVVDDDMVNAFAAPGGKIVVFQGIIDKTESWEALAGLLSHELAHVEERHSLKLLARSASSYLLISALTGDLAGASGLLIENAYKLKELSNSRDHEKDADLKGLGYLKDLGIRPAGMNELFEVLLAEQQDLPFQQSEILSTHPLSENRIKDIEEVINSQSEYQYTPIQNVEAESLWEQLKTKEQQEEPDGELEENVLIEVGAVN